MTATDVKLEPTPILAPDLAVIWYRLQYRANLITGEIEKMMDRAAKTTEASQAAAQHHREPLRGEQYRYYVAYWSLVCRALAEAERMGKPGRMTLPTGQAVLSACTSRDPMLVFRAEKEIPRSEGAGPDLVTQLMVLAFECGLVAAGAEIAND